MFLRAISLILATTAAAALGAMPALAATKPEPPKITGACTPAELWKIAPAVPAAWEKKLGDVLGGGMKNLGVYYSGHTLAHARTTVFAKTFGEYIMARSLHRMKLIHSARSSFRAILLGQHAPEAQAVRVAALECLNRIYVAFPTLDLGAENPEAVLQSLAELRAIAPKLVWESAYRIAKKKVAAGENPDLTLLANSGAYLEMIQFQQRAREENETEILRLGTRLLSYREKLPEPLRTQEDTIRLMMGRIFYAQGRLPDTVKMLRKVNNTSNDFTQALHGIAWAELRMKRYPESQSAAENLLTGALRTTFFPEAPSIAAINFFETCHFREALDAVRLFQRSYRQTREWLLSWKAQRATGPKDLYPVLANALKTKQGVPERILTEWIRSPQFLAYQSELNLTYEEEPILNALEPSLRRRKDAPSEALKAIVVGTTMANPALRKRLTATINQDLDTRTERMLTDLNGTTENYQLIEVEIYNSAGDDMIVRHATGGSVAAEMAAAQAKDKKKPVDPNRKAVGPMGLDWGRFPAGDTDHAEIWEDEIGFLRVNLTNACPTRQ